MSKKKNNKAFARRKQKKALKAKQKRPARIARRSAALKAEAVMRAIRRAQTFEAASLLQDGDQVPDITDEEHVFWLCHGANFIVSDEENGLWEPIFEDIYDGVVPEAEQLAQTILGKYAKEIDSEEALTGVPRSVLAWTVTEKSAVRIYKFESERRIREKDPDCDAEMVARQPHNPVVWGVMSEVKARTMAVEIEEEVEEVE